MLLAVAAGASPVLAASCKGASHEAELTSGSVSPRTGDPTGIFKFKVTYSDNAGCIPAGVNVVVSGVGTFAMEGSGGSVVSYHRSMQLPPGTHAYAFTATSGSGAGYRVITLAAVSPTAVVVTQPQPKPTASPKPTPTPRPTSPGTAASSTPSASSSATAATATDAPASPTASRKPRRGSPTPQPVVAAVGSLGGTSGSSPGLGALTPTGADAGQLSWLLAWLAATAGGLTLFFVMSRGHREFALAGSPAGGGFAAPGDTASPAASPSETRMQRRLAAQAGGEKQLPRWLRPSVQAARYARPGHPDTDA